MTLLIIILNAPSLPQKAFGKVAGKQAEAYEPPVSQLKSLRLCTASQCSLCPITCRSEPLLPVRDDARWQEEAVEATPARGPHQGGREAAHEGPTARSLSRQGAPARSLCRPALAARSD